MVSLSFLLIQKLNSLLFGGGHALKATLTSRMLFAELGLSAEGALWVPAGLLPACLLSEP